MPTWKTWALIQLNVSIQFLKLLKLIITETYKSTEEHNTLDINSSNEVFSLMLPIQRLLHILFLKNFTKLQSIRTWNNHFCHLMISWYSATSDATTLNTNIIIRIWYHRELLQKISELWSGTSTFILTKLTIVQRTTFCIFHHKAHWIFRASTIQLHYVWVAHSW